MSNRKEYLQNYYQTHKEQMNKCSRKWAKEHPKQYRDKQRKSNKKYRNNLKMKVISLLGSKCSNPECPIPRDKLDSIALQIDHIHGGGVRERKKIGRNDARFYLYILRKIQSGSKDYQLLCAYCNWMKQFKKRES